MVRQNIAEAVWADIRVAVVSGLSIWLLFRIISYFLLFSGVVSFMG